ncbi:MULTISPECIES: hypothetical protein [Streptomyces]|uniref:hypothetical protein n=1 Tax=Streptomyces TaxID=1883 RepID=UPI002255F235|nr:MULTISPECIES: hypothetical protein [Streptomyces]MCX4633444.1 hypothetical protein [Streptomyces sp. NBC_01443]WSC76233.1 hypothetical protein OHA56_07810 [Streptomyces virginiae]
MHHDDEPVFKRSKWGTNHYYYNPRNPVGLALIIITLLFVGTMMILMANRAGPFKPAPAQTPWSPPPFHYSPPLPSSSPTPWSPVPAPTGPPGH